MARKNRRRGKVAELKPGERLWAVVVDASDFFSPIGGRRFRKSSMEVFGMPGCRGVIPTACPHDPSGYRMTGFFDTREHAEDALAAARGRGIRCPSMVAMFTVGADGVPDYDDPDAEEVRSFFLGKTI